MKDQRAEMAELKCQLADSKVLTQELVDNNLKGQQQQLENDLKNCSAQIQFNLLEKIIVEGHQDPSSTSYGINAYK